MDVATWVLEVSRSDFAECKIQHERRPNLKVGEVSVEIENLAMTANTMTYAAMGDMGYWSLFPAAAESFGRVPAWGHGRVTASGVEGVAEGDRLFGLWPMASHVLLAGRRSRLGLRETSPWRNDLNPVYNQYALEPLATAEAREARATFHPLFITSFVLAQHLLELGDAGPRRIVVVSASSKTAQGTAFLLRGTRDLVGLTARRNAVWVRGTGLYGAVVAYDELHALEAGHCLVIDFSGNQALLNRVLTALGESAVLLQVGWTHGGSLTVGSTVGAGEGSVFSGPEMIQRYAAAWGPAEFDRRLGLALDEFTAAQRRHFTVEHEDGAKGMLKAYHAIQQGSIDASRLLVARPAVDSRPPD